MLTPCAARQYWQRAIASRPATCVKAYLVGGLAWFAIPFMFSTTLGLAAVALRGDPDMRVLTPEDVSAGLPASAAAAAILGKPGAASDATNGFIDPATLGTCVDQAAAQGWQGGIMSFEFPSADGAWIQAAKGSSFQ